MKAIINLLFVFMVCIISACNNHSNIIKQVSPVYSFKINADKVSKLNLQDIADLDRIIPLETKDECLITSIGKVLLTDSSLIVWDKGSEGYIATNPEVNARLVENAELLVDDEGLLIYRLPANPY